MSTSRSPAAPPRVLLSDRNNSTQEKSEQNPTERKNPRRSRWALTVTKISAPREIRRRPAGRADDGDDRQAWLAEQLATLDPELVRLIDLRYQQRWTLARIAGAVGLSIGTVDAGCAGRSARCENGRRRTSMRDADEQPLSAHGLARRDAIGALAVRAARRRRARRRLCRAGVVAVALLACGLLLRRPAGPTRIAQQTVVMPKVAPTKSAPATEAVPGVMVTYVQTDPTILDRLRVDPAAPRRWEFIGDRELLDSLAAAGQPAGLIRTGGRVLLVTP